MLTILDDFRHSTPLAVRFHDIDALGHVNNARYLNYLEEGRLAYARDVWGWDGRMDSFSLIVASVSVEFKRPIHLGDALTLYTRVARLGNKSFDVRYAFAVTPNGADEAQLAATASVTLVMYDYTQQQTVPIADTMRAAITDYEPSLPG